jgi:CubicO group peptidase (beta-lactamase class C family)
MTTAARPYLRDLEARDAFSGVVRITVGDEERFAGAYGLASRAWGVRNTLDTRFDTASITKLFTAVATLQQVDAGAFGLDTGAVGYLGLEGTTISPDVTVRHLLTHTSGIGDDADEEAGESYEAVWQGRPNYSVLEAADFLPQFVNRPPNFAPGQGCRYNNCGYVLLGLMVEQATGRSYRDVVQARLRARGHGRGGVPAHGPGQRAMPRAPTRFATTRGVSPAGSGTSTRTRRSAHPIRALT